MDELVREESHLQGLSACHHSLVFPLATERSHTLHILPWSYFSLRDEKDGDIFSGCWFAFIYWGRGWIYLRLSSINVNRNRITLFQKDLK